MIIKKFIITIIIILLSIFRIMGVEMDFGIFNYKGSRLKEIKRYGATGQDIVYKYDKDGYLIGRELKKDLNKIYTSTISYDMKKNIITEEFMLYFGNKFYSYTYLTYYYDEHKRFIKLIRQNENADHKNSEITINMDIEYNNENDIIRIIDTEGIPQYEFFPDDGIAYDAESIFKYEYEADNKIQYCFNAKDNKYYKYAEYYYDNKYLTKIITHPRFSNNEFSINYFNYDKNNNIIGIVFVDNIIDNKTSTTKIKYEYDNKNRLKKKTEYLPDDIKKNKVDETEEYFYEDGNYVYYPYLLPPKIKMYLTQQYEMTIDKFVF
jgi:hypothetical protein